MSLVRKIHSVAFQIHTRLLMCQHMMGTDSVTLTYMHSYEMVMCQLGLCLAGTLHVNYKNCKNEQLELHFFWKSEFPAPPTFFPGRQHCQNILFMQSSKRKKKGKQTINMKSAEPEWSSSYTHFFSKLLGKCLSLIRLSYFKACPVVVFCL